MMKADHYATKLAIIYTCVTQMNLKGCLEHKKSRACSFTHVNHHCGSDSIVDICNNLWFASITPCVFDYNLFIHSKEILAAKVYSNKVQAGKDCFGEDSLFKGPIISNKRPLSVHVSGCRWYIWTENPRRFF